MRNTAQMRALISGHIRGQSVRPGRIYWATEEQARSDIENRVGELAVAAAPTQVPGPSETPAAGPAEVKEQRGPLRRSTGWPTDRFSRVAPAWSGLTAVVAATGPSLSAAQLERVRTAGAPLVVVSDGYLAAPWADVVYFADAKWWGWHRKRPEWAAFAGQKCSIFVSAGLCDDAAIHMLRNARRDGLSTDPEEICTGSNSGYQAINIATLAGAKRVLLIGFDCRDVEGKAHFFGAHPDGTKPPYDMIRSRFATMVEPAKALGIEILNATPGSAIDCFPRVELEAGLKPHP